jgi:hypothetical protein
MKSLKFALVAPLAIAAGVATARVQDICGPFTDVSPALCPYVLEMYYLGITVGTSPTTYSPDNPVTRGQAAVFVSKGVNQTIARSTRRAALGQWWVPRRLGLSILAGEAPGHPQSDGADVWVPREAGGVERIRASDGSVLTSWSGADGGYAALVAMGRVFVTGYRTPGKLYMIDPSQPAGIVTTVADNLGDNAAGVAFDGARVWTANSSGSVSIVTPGASLPWASKTVSTGFSSPGGILFDGKNVWVSDVGLGALLKVDATGAVVQSIPIGTLPGFPAFDGANIWVPETATAHVMVIQASTGALLSTLTGNGLASPISAAFDGERVLIAGDSLSLWRAADFAPLGYTSHPSLGRVGACSDGVNYWVTFLNTGEIARF